MKGKACVIVGCGRERSNAPHGETFDMCTRCRGLLPSAAKWAFSEAVIMNKHFKSSACGSEIIASITTLLKVSESAVACTITMARHIAQAEFDRKKGDNHAAAE